MADCTNMRLCGGTFLVLLFEAKGTRRTSRVGEGRTSDGKSNPEIFSSLVRAVNPNFQLPSGRSFNTFTSDYKLCRSSDSPSAGLTDDLLIRQFDNDIQTKYYERLGLFFGRLERAIDFKVKGPWLVAALIDLIEADSTIPDDALFYVRPYGHSVKKADLRNIECICISSFVFGVWHYIITKIRDNTVGAETIDLLLKKNTESRAERKFASDIGKQTVSEIKTSVHPPECEWGNYRDPALEAATKNMPFAFVTPGVAADVRNIKAGQVFVNESQVFYLDGKQHDAVPSFEDGPFDTYLENAIDYYSTVKTLLYSEAPHNFKDIYVPNDIKFQTLNIVIDDRMKTRSIEVLVTEHPNNIIIRGTGGIGKSMMMRHLFLHYAERFSEYEKLPVLVPLKNFTVEEKNLEEFVFRAAYEFDHDLQFADFEDLLKNWKCIILLDGLDEIPTAARHHFDNCLVNFTKAYRRNHIVISSRPTSTFIQFGRFLVVEIEPFSKEKALELIDKLDYHDPEAKAKFRKDLSGKLYYSHQQFASIPLLLTIMLMTYTSYGEVPAKRHVFYAKAYETMARLHDATKGAYVRPMHTGLTPEEFAIYFAEFCARTYGAEVLEFDDRTFTGYMEQVIRHQKRSIDATPRDFLKDLTDNLCIMYQEGEKYYFIHRSFQEYFCAVFFSNQMDDRLWEIGEMFENQKKRMSGDMTFAMLSDMIPSRVDRYIFLPYLQKLWDECDAADGYWTFLEKMYPVIYAQEGESGDYYSNDPQFFIYEHIALISCHHHGELCSLKWPSDIDYFDRTEWTTIRTGEYTRDGKRYVSTEVVEFDSVDVDDDYIEEYGEPEVEGVSWEIDVHDLRKQAREYPELCAFMESDSFPLKQEYNEMRALTELLNRTYNSRPKTSNWFDSF